MRSSALIASLLSVCLVGGAIGADTLRVDFVKISDCVHQPFDLVTYEIVGTLQEGETASQGLAFFTFDVQIDGPTKISLGLSATHTSTADTASFEAPDGYSAEFGGTAWENDLIQGGGAQNTIGNTLDFEPFSIGTVELGVGFPPGGAVLMTGELSLPPVLDEGTYTMSIIPGSLFANVITLNPSVGDPPVYTVEVADVLIGDPLTLTVILCDDQTAPQVLHLASPTGVAFVDHAFSGHIDPRMESTDGANVDLGIDRVTFVFDEPVFDLGSSNCGTQAGVLTTAGFRVEETGTGPPPNVTGVNTNDNITVEVVLDRVITPQEWTTVIAMVEDACANPIEPNGNRDPGVNETDRIDDEFSTTPPPLDLCGAGTAMLLPFAMAALSIIKPRPRRRTKAP